MIVAGTTPSGPSLSDREDSFMRVTAGMGALALVIALAADDGGGPAGLVLPLLLVPTVALFVHGFVARITLVVLLPLVVAGPSVVFFVAQVEGSMFFVALAALLATYGVEDHRLANLLCAGFASIPVIGGLTTADKTGWQFWFFGVVLGWLFGRLARINKDLIGQLASQNELITEQAVLEERRRMARDVHDLVGHSLTVVLLHVTGARRAVRRNPDSAEAALESAERIGRDSLVEIRRSMELLRASDGLGNRPSPTALDIVGLVEERRTAGQTVILDITGDPERLTGSIGTTAYRLVQESLSNVAKHAPSEAATIEMGIGEHECTMIIENELTALGAAPGRQAAAGYGLIGMRERVQAIGGQLSVGPAGPVWRVDAVLPLETLGAAP